MKQIYGRSNDDEWEAERGPLLRAKLLTEGMVKSSIICAPCNHVNLAVGSDGVYIGKEFASDMVKLKWKLFGEAEELSLARRLFFPPPFTSVHTNPTVFVNF